MLGGMDQEQVQEYQARPPLVPLRVGRIVYFVVTVLALGYALTLTVTEDLFDQVLAMVLGLFVVFLTTRRLHDVDRTGWWSLLLFVPIVHILTILGLSVWPGTKGPNRFGPQTRV